MEEISIIKTLFQKFNFRNKEIMQNICEIIRENMNVTRGLGYLEKITGKLIFKTQIGGKKHRIKLENNKIFEFHIDIIKLEDSNQKIINFLNINENYENCAFILYDSKESGKSKMTIQGILNREDCIKCEDDKYIYKTGDIMMQIIIKLVKESKIFSHIKKIELSDVSKKKCFNMDLELKYLRTMTHGIPFYAKYGFRPKDDSESKFFRDNRENYGLNKKLLKSDFIQIIKSKEFDEKTIDGYNKYFKSYIQDEEIDARKMLIEIISLIDNDKIDRNDKKYLCKIINYIYKDIYKMLGYKEYNNNLWILKF